LSGVKVHHNFSYNSCGFFEVSSGGTTKGTFSDSEFYDNVSIDSGWLMLLQVNNTNLSNIRWENNTIVQHSGSSNAGMLTTIFTGTSSGQTGGSLAAGLVSMTNNLIVFDGVTPFGAVIDANITQTTNLIVNTSSQSPGMVNVKGTTSASDFDLTSSSPAIDKGTTTTHTLDYLNRTVPASAATDIGAFEYGAPGAGGSSSTGGAAATGGSGAKATGGAPSATGGKSSAGGVSSATTGGAPAATGGAPVAAGGTLSGTGGAGIVAPSGGTPATGGAIAVTGGSPATPTTGGNPGAGGIAAAGGLANATGGLANAAGGIANATGGIANTVGGIAGLGGQTSASTGAGGTSTVASATAGSGNGTSADNVGACSCSTVGRKTRWGSAALFALLALGIRRKRESQC
jgi:hypothetical protein